MCGIHEEIRPSATKIKEQLRLSIQSITGNGAQGIAVHSLVNGSVLLTACRMLHITLDLLLLLYWRCRALIHGSNIGIKWPTGQWGYCRLSETARLLKNVRSVFKRRSRNQDELGVELSREYFTLLNCLAPVTYIIIIYTLGAICLDRYMNNISSSQALVN